MKQIIFLSVITLTILLIGCKSDKQEVKKEKELLNVSYDPTREMYQELDQVFQKYWEKETGEKVTIQQSHGGSGKQARAVIDGLEADVVTLAMAFDIDIISEQGKLLPSDWQNKFPSNSCPYTSTIVFLVKKGNPKKIKDWDDLIKSNISVITPNPKTSGVARWNYLSAWVYAQNKYNGDETKVKEFMKKLFKNVPVLDTGARGSTNTFVQRGIGDVLLAWENEALLVVNDVAKGQYEIIYPSVSMLAEPPVAVVEKNAAKKGNLEVAKSYLNFLYTDEGQEIIAKHYYRPINENVRKKYSEFFKELNLIQVDSAFGGWKNAHDAHFKDGGSFDLIYSVK